MSAPGQPHTATEFTSFCTSKLKWYGRTTTKKGGSISRGEENPEITQRSWSQRSRTKKCYQKSTKDMLMFSSKSFSSSFFSPKIIYFFFLQTRWTCLWSSQEGRGTALCSSIAAKVTMHTLSRQFTAHCLSRKILICNAGLLKSIENGSQTANGDGTWEKHLIKGCTLSCTILFFKSTRESQ